MPCYQDQAGWCEPDLRLLVWLLIMFLWFLTALGAGAGSFLHPTAQRQGFSSVQPVADPTWLSVCCWWPLVTLGDLLVRAAGEQQVLLPSHLRLSKDPP